MFVVDRRIKGNARRDRLRRYTRIGKRFRNRPRPEYTARTYIIICRRAEVETRRASKKVFRDVTEVV